jgi:hypothetical protein
METVNTCPQAPRCERIVALNDELAAVGILYAGSTLMTASMALGKTILISRQLRAEMEHMPATESRCGICVLNPQPPQQPAAG